MLPISFVKFSEISKSKMEFSSCISKTPVPYEANVSLKENCRYTQTFPKEFNTNPKTALQYLIMKKDYLESDSSADIGPFLFYCNGLSPSAITNCFMSNQREVQSLYYFFFSSPILNYLSIHEAARILISRVALPNDMSVIKEIADAFAKSYYFQNQYISESLEDISKLLLSDIIYSINFRNQTENLMSQEQFLILIKSVNASDSYKLNFYNSLRMSPIPLFFTFLSSERALKLDKVGQLKRGGGRILKKKSNLYYKIKNNELQYFKDSQLNEFYGGIGLNETMIQYVKPSAKESAYLSIRRYDNQPFGYKIKKFQRKLRKKNAYTLYGTSDDDTKDWFNSIQFTTFYSDLLNFVNGL